MASDFRGGNDPWERLDMGTDARPPNAEGRLPASDGSLIRQVRAGENTAAAELFDRYATRILSFAQAHRGADLAARFDPEDILQSVFRTFFRRVGRGEYDLPDGDSLWKLLFVISLNKVRARGGHHRAGRRDVRATTDGPAADNALAAVPGADEVSLADLRMTVTAILDGLPASQRAIIERRMDGDKVDDIIRKTGRSRRTVERAVHDFCHRLRDELGHEG